MPIDVHHLGLSQSERIVFLLEELSIPYKLIKYDRAPTMAPPAFKSLPGNETGQAPLIIDTDTGITLSESGAIVEYILSKYAHSAPVRLNRQYGDPDYRDYIYFLHFVNATLQPAMSQAMLLSVLDPKPNPEHPMVKFVNAGVDRSLGILDAQLAKHKWLAGDEFTAADCMVVYSLTTKRYFGPLLSYEKFPNVVRYLADIGKRPGYQRAIEKGDPEMQTLLGAEPPKENLLLVGGVQAASWRKGEGK